MGKKRTRRIAALLLSLLLALPAPSALAAESALESASSASSQAPEGESSGEESAAQPAEESSAPESSQPAGEESQPGEGESSQEEPSSQEPSSSQEESSSQVPEDESTGEESGISMEDSQQETFASYPLLVVGGHEAYMSGEAGARFYPDRAMTRAEMAQVLYNLLASYPPVTGGSFSDVSAGAWYATAVNTLVELDVLSGYEDGTFRPNNAVTRAEFVTAVCKCFDSLSTGSAGFSDVSGHWAEGFINQAVAEDWISGFPDGTFRPDESIQRCQVTAILNKALERTGSGFAADAGTQEFVDVPSSHWAYEHIAEAADPCGQRHRDGLHRAGHRNQWAESALQRQHHLLGGDGAFHRRFADRHLGGEQRLAGGAHRQRPHRLRQRGICRVRLRPHGHPRPRARARPGPRRL